MVITNLGALITVKEVANENKLWFFKHLLDSLSALTLFADDGSESVDRYSLRTHGFEKALYNLYLLNHKR